MGDKYDVIGIKDLAKDKFGRACKHFWGSANLPIAANHVFLTTVEEDSGLRNRVSAAISDHIVLIDNTAVKVLLKQCNGLALGMLEATVKEHGWGNK